MDERCRLCLTFSLENVDLFANEAKYISVKEIVKNLTGIKIYECKELPSSICISCIDLIDVIINFKATILNSQKNLQNEKKITSTVSLKSEISSDVDQNNDIFCEEIKVEGNEWDYEPTQYLSSELLESNNLDDKEDNKSLKPKVVNKREKTKNSDKKRLKKSEKSSLVTLYSENSNNLPANVTHKEDDSSYGSTTGVDHIDSEISKSIKSTKKKPKVNNSNAKRKENSSSREDTLKAENSKSPDKTSNLENLSTEKAWRKYKASYDVACHICGKMISKFVIKNHLNIHTGTYQRLIGEQTYFHGRTHCRYVHLPTKRRCLQPYKCDVENCNKTFKSPANLYQHKVVAHSNEERFKCKECGKGFKLSYSFKKHMTSHFDPQLPCDICGKFYKTQQNLRIHIRRHKNERNYKCDQCEGAFITSSLLKRHIMTHTGVKPYKCEFCGKDFRYKQMLKTHCEKYHQTVVSQ